MLINPFRFETLEPRLFLSTSIPINTTSWTIMGPAPLDWGATSFGLVSGRILDIATHPTDANTWYIATASGGVWKTTNGGTGWTPLTDQQPINYMGSIALAPSNPSIVYVGSGEATWGPGKKILNRDNIYYGRGVLKSTDAGATWTLTGQTEFFRRSIGKIIVHPTDPNTVWAAVGAEANNGLPGNTGIWKTTNGGTTWTNTTTSISTTTAFSDLVIDPSNPLILYAAVGDPDGDATNGLYKTVNGGASWTPISTFTNQNDARLGRITLAIAPSSPLVVYAWVGASGQAGTTAGADFQFVGTSNGGTSWTARTLPNTGVSLDYNMALVVDPANANTVYAASKGSGGPSATSVKKSTNGGTSWVNIGVGLTQSPHADHHALVYTADGKILDGNDGGIWRLENPNPPNVDWNSRNTNLGTIQLVGVALHPTDGDIAYGGSQDNGTEIFEDQLYWPVIRGGDGGVTRVDPTDPDTIYHTFYYSGAGFLERSDDGGSSWLGKTTGINTTTDPAYFYPHYMMDPIETNRLILGTNRVYRTINRADNWTPISTPNTAGWASSAIINAVAIARSDPSVIYGTAEGDIFVTINGGANWLPVVDGTTRFTDIVVDPTDAGTAYFVSGRFGSQARILRSTNFGTNVTNISGNLPEVPMYSVELDVRGPGIADDVIWVGGDDGVWSSSDGGATWAVLGAGLPRVQAKDIEYNRNLGILAVGTHGRGMWQLSVPDQTAPQVTSNTFAYATAPHQLRYSFSEAVNASLAVADLTLQNLTTSTTVPPGSIALTYNQRLDTATFTFPGFANGVLPDGRYRATLAAAGVRDGANNPLPANAVLDFVFLLGDANNDGRVNLSDYNILAANFNQSPRDFTQGDFNYDGLVNLADYNILSSRYNTVIAPDGTVTRTGGRLLPGRFIASTTFASKPIRDERLELLA